MRKAALGLTSLAALALCFACGSDGNAIFDDDPQHGEGARAGSDSSGGTESSGASGSGSGGSTSGGSASGSGGSASGSGGTNGDGGTSPTDGGDGGSAGRGGEGGGNGGEGASSGDGGEGGGGGPQWPDVIFVATTGTDSDDCGLEPVNPCASISRGVARGVAASRATVQVQAGTYPGVVVLASGIHVLGGFDAEWERGPYTEALHQVIIEGGVEESSNEYLAVWAHDLAQETRLENVVLAPPNAAGQREGGLDGRSSYGVHAASAKLSLKDVEINVGDGAPGANGANGIDAPSTAAHDAMNGKPGGDGTPMMSGMTCNNVPSEGGPPGTNSCDGVLSNVAPNGGKGGSGGARDNLCGGMSQDDTAQAGGPGADASTVSGSFGLHGNGGTGSISCGATTGGNAGAVSNGAKGVKAAATPTLLDGFLYARSGGAGATGQNGSGGGGGGGAGGCDAYPNESRGAGGGGGGAGGCAARGGGAGGGGGGSSVGVFALESTLEFSGVTIVLGAGADGGNGGNGGQGQSGGRGSAGGAKGGSATPGKGGDGAHGGHGGGGAGGNGGFAIGVYSKTSTVTGAANVSGGSAGKGGAGGASAPSAPPAERDGNAGEDGNAGSVIEAQNE